MRNLSRNGRAAVTAVALATAATFAACSDLKDNLLEAPDPDIIDPGQVQSANGASAVRLGALGYLRLATAGSGNAGTEGTWLLGGLLADEWSTSSTFVQNDETDERFISQSNSSVEGSSRALYRVILASNQAIGLLKKYKPSPASDIAELYFARGFAQLQLASDFCNGIPLSDASGTTVVLDSGRPVADVFAIAIASFDTALTTTTTDAAGVIVANAAKIGKARALLGINKPAEAAAAVAGIATTGNDYVVTSSLTTGQNNGLWNQGASQRRYTVGDSAEGNDHKTTVLNAIPFFSAKDPRVPVAYTTANAGKDTTKGQDGSTFSRTTSIWGQTSNTTLTSGLDARLIEAEAAFRAGNPAQMITILNTLRANSFTFTAASPTSSGTHPGYSYTANALPALVDPGNDPARVSLLFREKAFWTFGRGQRLGDMRRLIRQYGRTANQVFPVTVAPQVHYRGAPYGADVNLPITTAEKNGNPNFSQCTDRNA